MSKQAPLSLEALKLRLINTASHSDTSPLLTKDGIRYLIKALAYADASFSTEIENVLVKAGTLAVPELIKNLAAENLNVRSVAAMALIRLGKYSEDALTQAYAKYSRKASSRWVFQFVLQELGLEVPQVIEPGINSVIALNRVG